MIGWFRKNGGSIFWALALAVAVWIAAVTAADPDEQHAFSKPVPVEIVGQDSGLVILGDAPQNITVTLRAPRSVWNRLDASDNPIRAVVDLSGLGAGEHIVEVQVQVSDSPALLILAQPSSFTIALEPLATKVFPVDLSLTGQPAIGYQSGDAMLDPQEVLVSGAQSLVDQVNRVRVVVILSGTRESVNQTENVELLDVNNQPVKGLSIHPLAVQVSLPVSQQGGYRDVAVKVNVHGQVASGYLLTNLSVFPPVITVYSTNPELVNLIPGVIETQVLELRGASENISTRLALNLPEGVSVVGEQSVQVQVGIEPIQSNLTLSRIAIEVTGLPEGMMAQVSPAEVDVILSGPAPLLDQLARQDIRVIVDVTGLAPGTYQLKPVVDILIADIIAQSILPNTVEVVIAPAVTPTP